MTKIMLIVVAIFACLTAFSMMAVGEHQVTGGKCSFDSDCSHGKCKAGKCGSCNFDSDCKGFGKCQKNECGSCNFESDCQGFGKCEKNQCTKSPW